MRILKTIFKPRGQLNIPELEQEVARMELAKARYERIFRGQHSYGFMDWNVKKRKISWSGGFWTHLGYSQSDMKYLSDPIVGQDYIHDEDRDKVVKTFSAIMKGDEEREIIYRLRRKKGGYVWTEVRLETDRDNRGRVNYLSGVAFDITHLKQTEQALLESENLHARIIQSSSDGIWEWTAQGEEFHFSNRCWQHLGFNEEDDAMTYGKDRDRMQAWRERIHPDYVTVFDRALYDHTHFKTPYDVEYCIMAKDGSWRWIRARGQMSFSDAGEPLRMSGTNMDITDLKTAEEEVLRAKEEAERANKAKSDFLSSMSHELRTPLNAILAYSQLFDMEKNLGEEQRINNREIKKAGLHLKQLVGDVLDLAKIEAGGLRLSLQETNLFSIVRECLLLVQAELQKKNIQVTMDVNSNNETRVYSSPMHLRQVVLNLLTNAVKYNRHGGNVHVEFKLTPGKTLKFLLSDTGCGVPQALQSELFQPFNRLGAEGGQEQGSGVGLVITRNLVEQMGGNIGFESEENQGSTFWFELPLAKTSSKSTLVSPMESSENSGAFELHFSGHKKILYVEDNSSNQRVMSQIIARFSQLDLVLEQDAERGIFSARRYQPDLILLDINLPGIDGYEVLSLFKNDALTRAIPIIALSANAMSHDIERGLDAGFHGYLTKPIDLEKLVETFNQCFSDLACSISS